MLDLVDDFTPKMAKAAAVTALLDRELNSLSNNSIQASRSSQAFIRDVQNVSVVSTKADRSINQLTGRLRLFADLAATLGPALVPLGGVALAGVAGLANQMGVAAIAGGVLVGSMQGLGDALDALNKAHLEPTSENLREAEDALNALSPAAANFAREAYGLLPVLQSIRDAGAEGLFPGLTDSLDDLERLAPVVAGIFNQVGSALGDIASGGAASLASDRWADFFEFIANEAPRTLSELASTVGSLTHGLAELWMAFEPLNDDFSGWLRDVASGFDSWAAGLSQTDGFRDFVDYIRTTGPQVADTMGALANAVVQIVQAAAPLGGPTLAAIEALANALAFIADSAVGTELLAIAAGMAAVTRASSLMKTALSVSTTFNPWLLAVGAGVTVLSAWSIEAQRAAAEARAFGDSLEAMTTGELADGLREAQQILAALDGGLGSGVIEDRVAQLEREIQAREEAAEASRRQAEQSAYYDSLQAENRALETNIGLMQAKRDEALRGFSAETSYASAILDSKNAIEENGRAWNLNTEAGINNRRALEQQASAWNELNRSSEQTPGAFRRARNSLIETAEQMGASKREARQYADQLLDIPDNLSTRIALDVDTASQRVKAIKAELASIDRNIDVYINVRRPNAGGFGPQVTGAGADGMTLPDSGLGYADRYLIWAADREEVVSDRFGGASKNRAELKAASRGAKLRVVPGYASGGTVGRRKGGGEPFEIIRGGQGEQAQQQAAEAAEAYYAEQARAERERERRAEHETNAFLAAIEGQERAAQGLITAAEEQKQSAEAVRDGWAQAMERAGSGATSGFQSSLFGSQRHGLWAGAGSTGSSWRDALLGDISGLTERQGLVGQLATAGLGGAALEALLTQGSNTDISSLLASGEVAEFGSLFNQRAALTSSVSAQVGQAAYGAEFAVAAANVAALGGQILQLQQQLAAITAQRPITVYEAISAQATAAEVARLMGAA